MLDPRAVFDAFRANGVDFFTGVPDSLLKNFCAYVTDHAPEDRHIIAANEGGAVALAAGHYLASGRPALVYMQNSGEGNAVNPLLSLTDPDVYGIPLLLLIGWRGEPGVHDEPQHVKQGKVTLALLEAAGIPYSVLDASVPEPERQIAAGIAQAVDAGGPFAFVVRKGAFAPYVLQKNEAWDFPLTREQAVACVTSAAPENAVFVSTTGMASRELFEIRARNGQTHGRDFLTVGSMGHASQIALALALEKRGRPVYCLDGDGAFLMHMGAAALTGTRAPAGFFHIVLNNAAHDSVGGQPTAARNVDLPAVAKACGYAQVCSAETEKEIVEALARASAAAENGIGPSFLEIKVRKGARPDLGRPTVSPKENLAAFRKNLDQN